jgi:hypothetical protein
MYFNLNHYRPVNVQLATMPASSTSLDLSNNALHEIPVSDLIDGFNVITSGVINFNLSRNYFGMMPVDEFVQLIAAVPHWVTILNLSYTELYRLPHVEIAKVLQAIYKAVTSLDLSHNGLGKDARSGVELAVILKSLHQELRTLNLGYNELNNMKSTDLDQAFKALPSMLETLILDGNHLGFIITKNLAKAFAALPNSLKTLTLRHGVFHCRESELAELFASIPLSLTTLDLMYCSFQLMNPTNLVKAFKALSHSLTTLNLGGNNLFAFSTAQLIEIIKAIPPVTTLDLSENGKISAEKLIEVLNVIPRSVTKLIFAYIFSKITANEIAAVIKAVPSSVTILDLSSVDFGLYTNADLEIILKSIPQTMKVIFSGSFQNSMDLCVRENEALQELPKEIKKEKQIIQPDTIEDLCAKAASGNSAALKTIHDMANYRGNRSAKFKLATIYEEDKFPGIVSDTSRSVMYYFQVAISNLMGNAIDDMHVNAMKSLRRYANTGNADANEKLTQLYRDKVPAFLLPELSENLLDYFQKIIKINLFLVRLASDKKIITNIFPLKLTPEFITPEYDRIEFNDGIGLRSKDGVPEKFITPLGELKIYHFFLRDKEKENIKKYIIEKFGLTIEMTTGPTFIFTKDLEGNPLPKADLSSLAVLRTYSYINVAEAQALWKEICSKLDIQTLVDKVNSVPLPDHLAVETFKSGYALQAGRWGQRKLSADNATAIPEKSSEYAVSLKPAP